MDDAKLRGNAHLNLDAAAPAAASPQTGPEWFAGRANELAFHTNAHNALINAGLTGRDPLPSGGEPILARARCFRFAKRGLVPVSLVDLRDQIQARADQE